MAFDILFIKVFLFNINLIIISCYNGFIVGRVFDTPYLNFIKLNKYIMKKYYYYYLLLAILTLSFSTNSYGAVKVKAFLSAAPLSDGFQAINYKDKGRFNSPKINNEQGFGILVDIINKASHSLFIDYYSLSEEISYSSSDEPKFSTSSFALGYKYNFLFGLYLGGGFMFSDYNYEIDDDIDEYNRYSRTYKFPMVTTPMFVLGYDYIYESGFTVGAHLARTLRADVTADYKDTRTDFDTDERFVVTNSFSGERDFDDLVITTLGLGIGYTW